MLSGRGLCDGPIACLEESYQAWCVSVIIEYRGGPGSLGAVAPRGEKYGEDCQVCI